MRATCWTDVFLLIYCDNYWPLDLADMNATTADPGLLGMMTVYSNMDGKENTASGMCGMGRRRIVFGLRTHTGGRRRYRVWTSGFFILNRETVALLPSHNCSIQNGLLPQLIEKGQLAAYRTDRHYYTITAPGLLKNIERILEGEAARPTPVAGQGGS